MRQRTTISAILLLILLGSATAMPQSVSVRGWNVVFDTISPVTIETSKRSEAGIDADQILVKDMNDSLKSMSISLGHYASGAVITSVTMRNSAEGALGRLAGLGSQSISSKPYTLDGRDGIVANAYATNSKRDVYEAMYPLDLAGQQANWVVSVFSFFDDASTYNVLDSLRITPA